MSPTSIQSFEQSTRGARYHLTWCQKPSSHVRKNPAFNIATVGTLILIGMLLIASCSSPQLASDPVSDVEAELGVKLEASRISVGDVELFVVQAGPTNGPPVLLLHGFPEFWYAWRGPMAELAAAGYRVIVPDQRGYGFSDKPSSVKSYNVERIAEDAAALISALGHESAYEAAHDWGGSVAWQLAMRRPCLHRRRCPFHPSAH